MEELAEGGKVESRDINRMFASIDSMRVDEILAFFAEDIYFQLGNNEPARGKDAVRQGISAFFSSIEAMRHTLTGIWTQDDVAIFRTDVAYTRKDGKVVTLPCASIVEYRGPLIKDYRVYIDVSPVFA